MMRFAVALAALSSVTSAHTVFTTLFIDDVNQGDGTCVRMPKDPDTCTAPIASLDSEDMACGKDGGIPVAFTCPASAGSKLTFEFREWADASNPGSIDSSHKGPCAVYLKPISNMATDSAAGGGWFKIWDEGYDENSQQWCTEKLITNNGLLSASVPDGTPTGYYLVRPELLALQEADKGDPQFYVGCAQLFVKGTAEGDLQVPEQYQAEIPGYVTATDKSVTFNVYSNPLPLPYEIPGPQPFAPTLDAAPARRAAEIVQSQGIIPDTCMLKNANWCGIEVATYSDEDGCWSASEDCFEQQAVCYESAPPSGSKGCDMWGDKCTAIQNACGDGDFNGPPSAGDGFGNVNAAVPGPIPPAAPTTTGAAAPAVQETGTGDANNAISPSKTTEVVTSTTEAVPIATPTEDDVSESSPSKADSDSDGNVDGNGSEEDGDPEDEASSSGDDSGSGVSQDGSCGRDDGLTCEGSSSGGCCSAAGWCGSSRLHCGRGCQDAFGFCN